MGNKAVPILFGNFTDGRKAGATGVTDNKMAQVISRGDLNDRHAGGAILD